MMRTMSSLFLIFFMTIVLAACSKDDVNHANTANITEPGIITPDDSVADQPSESPPSTTEIEVTVEGNRQIKTGTLAVSDNGYYLYTLPQFKFTPEEPNMDQVYMDQYEEFYMRIQTLGSDADIAFIRDNAEEELAILGNVVEMSGEAIGEAELRDSVFYLHASDSTLSKYIIVREIDGLLFKITVNVPNSEAAEGAAPSFPAMVKTIQPTN